MKRRAVIMRKNVCLGTTFFFLLVSFFYPLTAGLAAPAGPMGAPDTYKALGDIRNRDIYPDETVKHYLIDTMFPHGVETMALKLSNVTAGFYGITLKQVGAQCGQDKVDPVSRALFRELGRLKTAEAREMGMALPKDSRALGMVFVTAVYTSSPEYNFEFVKYTPEETVMKISGADRYYRMAKKLNIDSLLTWPTLITFFEGIAEQMGIKCGVTMKINKLEKDGTCDFLARFVMDGQKAK
jgi:hypothetical protein